MRIGLPSLTTFGFHGIKEYLEDLVAQIDTPQLDYFRISYFNQLDFQVPQLSRFIVRTQSLYLARFKRARVDFGANNVYVSLYCEREELLEGHFSLQISCQGLDWQVSHVAQTLSQSAALLSNVDDLSIDARELSPGGKDYMDGTEWLDLLRPFTAVETLHVCGKLAGHVAHGLEGATGDMVVEILPSLYSLSLEDEPLTSVERFVEVRRLSGRPVTIVNEFFERLESPPEPERVPYSSALNFELRPVPPTAKVSQDSHISNIGTCSCMRDAATPPRDARSRRNGKLTSIPLGRITVATDGVLRRDEHPRRLESKNLGYWPPFPLILDYRAYCGADDASDKSLTPGDEGDVIAALEHPDRVRYVGISVTRSLLGKMAAAMQDSFPILTHLWLSSDDGNVPALPNTFLGGSAPSLQVAHLEGIPLLAFPKLLSSATDLVNLQLLNIPKTGFVLPDAMVAGLTTLTMLETLSIEFQSPTPLPDRRCPPPSTRVPFPSLVTFKFRGVSDYLEGLVARIDAPLLKAVTITYFNQLTFQIPRLSEFISHAEGLYFFRFKHARVDFGCNNVYVRLDCDQSEQLEGHLMLQILCQDLEWQVSHVVQILGQCFPTATLSSVGDLSVDTCGLQPSWKEDIDRTTEWPALLRPLTAVETLHISNFWGVPPKFDSPATAFFESEPGGVDL
ncbi:hypothetical protein EDB86DRAFT_3101529 [Lactarius hatsudake]|nr:hypothetical protein EDB86DRAFT_3101529 [Lactarius hatsudake]